MDYSKYHTLDFYSALLDAMPNLVFVKNADLRFVYVNDQLAKLFATNRQAMLGRKDEDFISDQAQIDQFRNADRNVLLTRKPKLISEEFLNGADGVRRRLATVKVPFEWGAALHVLGIATDITEIPTGRTEADSLKLAIVSELAHVIKAPIANAAFNLSAMQWEIEQYVHHGRTGGAFMARRRLRIERLQTNIMDVQRALLNINITSRTFAAIAQMLGSPPKNRKPEPKILAQIVNEQVREMQPLVPTARLDVDIDTDAARVRVMLDPTDLSLVKTALYNVVHNALKFSPAEARIYISLRQASEALVISIRDEGSGIAPADMTRIFDAGFSRQAIGYTSGTGMGLTIAKQTFTRLGWDLDVSSDLGRGTLVRISIPGSGTAV